MSTVLLQASAITKSFAGVRALRGVSFDLRPGEVHALVGENGAGKSTLIKIITGAETADSGTLLVAGRTVAHMDPATSRQLGIAAIYQQPALFPDLTVAENIALSLERGGAWRPIDWKARGRQAAELLARVGASIDPQRLVESLSMPEQQLVEIAKAIGVDAKVVIMDEPTAALTDREVESLFRVIDVLRQAGSGIIYISHRLEEVFTVADRITVLRDGETIATCAARDVTRPDLIRMMVGRELTAVFPKRPVAIGAVALDVRGVSNRAAGVRDVSFTVKRGEIFGLAGLVGSGRTQLAETLFGLTPLDAGEIVVDGATVDITSPADAIKAGIGYVPEDRRRHGVVLEMDVAANASLANLDKLSRRGLLDREAERQAAQTYVDRLPDQDSLGLCRNRDLVRWQSAEGGPRALARHRAVGAHPRRADTGRGRWLESGNPRVDAGAHRAWTGDRHDLVGVAGNPRDERPHRRHARGNDSRSAHA